MSETDSGGLLVQIGVTQARMERELAKLVKDAAKSAGDMEKSFQAANNNISKSAASAFGKVPQAANQATGAIRNTSGATSNLASQLNDIGVQLAGGQSPFLIMLQQGTQITQLFTQTGGSIRSFGSLLAGAVTSVLNPFSLLTFAIIGAGGYAVQYFADLVSGGEKTEKALKEQETTIRNIAKSWAENIPALDAYIQKLDEANKAAEAAEASQVVSAQITAKTREDAKELSIYYADAFSLLQQAGAESENIYVIGEAFENLKGKVESGTATQEDFNAVIEAVRAAGIVGVEGIELFLSKLASLSASAISATAEVNALNSALAQASNRALNDPKTWRSYGAMRDGTGNTGGGLQNDEFATTPDEGPVPGGRPSDLSTPKDRGFSKPKGGGGRGANAYKDEVASIKERTAALRESTAAQAAINPLVSDYGFAMEKAKAEQQLLADAQRAGMAITPQLKEQISALATGYAQASADAKKLAEEQKNIRKNAEEWATLEKDVFKGFISDLKAGKSGAEALSNALNKVADKLLDMALDGLFSTKSGTGGGSGIFGSILSGIGKLFGFGFASGTANTGGKRGQPRGVVHGQEAVIPLPAGGKVPVQLNSPDTKDLSRKMSRDVVDVNLIDDSGRMAEIADQRIRTASGTIVQVSVKQAYNQVKGNMASLMTDTQARSL